MLPLHHTGIIVDETRFELVRLRLQRNALPLELFVLFIVTGFLTDHYFLIIEFTCFKQLFQLSPAEDSNFFLSICSRMHTPCLPAGHLKAESKGFEPLHRINDDGVAGHYITTLSTLRF